MPSRIPLATLLPLLLLFAGCDLFTSDPADISGDWQSEEFDWMAETGERLGTVQFSAALVQHEGEITGGGLLGGDNPFTLEGSVDYPEVFLAFDVRVLGVPFRFDCIILRAGQMQCEQDLSGEVEAPEFRLTRD